MYVFYRSVRLGPGSAHEELTWAFAITEKVNQISEASFNLWTTFMSPAVNSLVWTTYIDDLSMLEATNDKLMADNGYLMLLEQGARYTGGEAINDGLAQLIVADVDQGAPPAYIGLTAAQLAPGAYVKGVAAGIEIAERAKKIMGVPVSFAMGSTGTYGGVSWMAAFSSIQQLQAGTEALNSDPGFAEYLDSQTPTCFQPNATETVFRRLV